VGTVARKRSREIICSGDGRTSSLEDSMNEIRVGTCSWSDKSLLSSRWYPSQASDAASRLRFYANYFDTVEIDSSFYAIPSEAVLYQWVSRTPPDFVFNMKSFGLFTHHAVYTASLPSRFRKEAQKKRTRLQDLPKEYRRELWDIFYERVMVLHRMGRLGYLLFQFPPSFDYGEAALDYIRRLAEISRPARVAIEVRHRSWLGKGQKERFLDLLREENMAYVAVDEPRLLWTVPFEWHVTATWATVLRLHGRNKDGWIKKGATVAERFAYRYGLEELAVFAEEARRLSGSTGRVFIMFNNCFRDYAVGNALQMKEMLGLGRDIRPGDQKALDLEGNP
jgi:uncharacterized protein YecE (DUF72 family)